MQFAICAVIFSCTWNRLANASTTRASLLIPTTLSLGSSISHFDAVASRNLLHVINDRLDFSRISAGKLALDHADFSLRATLVDTLRALEEALLEFPGCAVITSHDRYFLDKVATHILAYEGDSQWFWFEGNFDSYEKNKVERLGAEAARPHRATYRKLTRG